MKKKLKELAELMSAVNEVLEKHKVKLPKLDYHGKC